MDVDVGRGNIISSKNAAPINISIGASGDMAFDNLYPAVIECFFVIICGYIAGKASLISPFEAKGLNTFVGTFALPCLIFHSLAELNFASVNWKFLLAIFISKTVVFIIVVLITILVHRPVDFGRSGLYAIFCTQSNDFALGYPIIFSLYKNIHPEFPSYLYLVAPVSLVFLNPIGFVMMEWQKRRDEVRLGEIEASKDSAGSLCLQIAGGVAKNPIVIMTALGIVGNFAFQQCVPAIIVGILKVFAAAYPATALFVLGLRLVGSLRRLHGAALVVPAILIMTKGLVFPLITREVVDNLQPGTTANETKDFSDYGFLYGTFPTAPPVFVYAAQYNIEVDMIASAMVIGTFLSAMVMFVSAKMVTLTNVLPDDYMDQLNVFLLNVAIFGIIASVGVIGIFTVTRKWRKMPHFVTFCLVISQVVDRLYWGDHVVSSGLHGSLEIVPAIFRLFVRRIFITDLDRASGDQLVASTLEEFDRCAQISEIFSDRRLPGVIASCLLGVVAIEAELIQRRDPNFQYGRTQAVVALIVLIVCFLTTVSCLIVQQRLKRNYPGGRAYRPVVFEAGEDDELLDDDGDTDSSGLRSNRRRRRSSGMNDVDNDSLSSYGVASEMEVLEEVSEPPSSAVSKNPSFATKNAPSVEQDVNRITTDLEHNEGDQSPEKHTRRSRRASEAAANRLRRQHTVALQQMRLSLLSMQDNAVARAPSTVALSATMRACSSHFNSLSGSARLQFEESTLTRGRDSEHQLLRHVILLLILCTSMLVGLSLCLWTLVVEGNSGIYIELVFLDVALNFGQSFFVFALFGLDEKLVIAPLLKRWRRCFHGTVLVEPPPPGKLSPETIFTCQQFVSYHMDSCVRDIVRDRKFRNKFYRQAFCGNEFVDWVLVVGLAPDRAQAAKYGKHLLTGRVLRHYDNEHHFHDQPLFYTFCDPIERDRLFQSFDPGTE
ncbi:unnamed protein product [Notodromas monacha]|uniref:DEP domain-containing protein n=1 Tax=Notodromas monacha TaxID=399045 RepID=A0A7R9BL25_9CRUS|nr:unnamed protein product [Notodromas monacha]CAG0916670.1 unnamed protein product [Notodromas monacha]